MPEGLFQSYFPNLMPGLILEFGVSSGASIREMAWCCKGRTIYGFDTFTGLPEDWEGRYNEDGTLMHMKGSFASDPPGVPENVVLITGMFQDTLPGFLEQHPEQLALAHVDCDLYSSTKCVLECLEDRIVDGTILIFDEFMDYGDHRNKEAWKDYEYKAFCEFLEKTGYGWECIGRHGSFQVAFKICKEKTCKTTRS